MRPQSFKCPECGMVFDTSYSGSANVEIRVAGYATHVMNEHRRIND